MLCGTILGARAGRAKRPLLFLVLTALGLPLLAGGRGGLAVFASPSVGFLIGFPIAAFVHRMEHAAFSAVFHWPSQRPGRPAWRYYCAVYPWRYWPIHK